MRYQIVSKPDPSECEDEVNKLLEEGWELYGNLFVPIYPEKTYACGVGGNRVNTIDYHMYYTQAMKKEATQ